MAERPILFSGPMVQAILAGRKTQTRRLFYGLHGGQPVYGRYPRGYAAWEGDRDAAGLPVAFSAVRGVAERIPCPYGDPGDRLWVRETWRPEASKRAVSWELFYPADGQRLFADLAIVPAGWLRPKAALTGNVPGIHMPRWASRLTLEVTEVRMQRLQDISEEDARAEGVGESAFVHPGNADVWAEHAHERYRLLFQGLWEKINGERKGCAWKDNPWVWAISFRRLP